MARRGRPNKLTPDREKTIVSAIQQVGVTQEEAARLAGIGEKTFYRWKQRAAEAAALLPADWRAKRVAQLRDWLWDLGVETSEVRGTGRGGRVVRKDLIAELHARAGKFRDFFTRLEAAYLEGEAATVGQYRELATGGRWIKDEEAPGGQRWVELEKVVERYVPEVKEGKATGKLVLAYKDVIANDPGELARRERGLRFILERRHRRWTSKKALDITQTTDDPASLARKIQEALGEIEGSIPGAP